MIYPKEYLKGEITIGGIKLTGPSVILDYHDLTTYLRKIVKDVQFGVWRFDEAPQYLKTYCNFAGGDEDWIIVTRTNELDMWIDWLGFLNRNGDMDEYHLEEFIICVITH